MESQPPTATAPEMPALRDIIRDLANNRAYYIDRYIDRRLKHRGPDFEATTGQYDTWTAEAVAKWQELYPTLQALWEYETATRSAVSS